MDAATPDNLHPRNIVESLVRSLFTEFTYL